MLPITQERHESVAATEQPQSTKHPWQLPPEELASISGVLDDLHDIAGGVIEISGPGGQAMRQIEESGTCTDEDRYRCTAEIVLPAIQIDGRNEMSQQLEDGLFAVASRLMAAADEVAASRARWAPTD